MRLKHLLLTLMAATVALTTVSLKAQPVELVGITNSLWKYSVDGSDQYTAGFQASAFDDTAWLEGRALFGNDTGYPYPFVTAVPGPSTGGPMTAYYRIRFNWAQSISGVVLTMTNYIDDGIIIYLNGTEIARYNMNADNPATAATLAVAANPAGEGVPIIHQVTLDSLTNASPNPLIQGQNVLAVSVHQNAAGSSDHVFGMSVYASQVIAPCAPGSSGGDRTVVACLSTTFAITLPANCGVPAPTIQWYKNAGADDEAITGATGTSLTLTNLSAADQGQYFARISNSAGTQDSTRSTLTVSPDTQPPSIVQVLGLAGAPNTFVVTFNEPVDDTEQAIASTFNWAIYPVGSDPSQSFQVSQATLTNNATQVYLVTLENREAGVNYELQLGVEMSGAAVRDVCAGNRLLAATAAVYSEIRILHHTDLRPWRYNQSGADQGTAWREVNFDDSSWAEGVQGFGNEGAGFPDAPDSQRTPLTRNPEQITYYFRTTFNLPAGAQNVRISARVDDGAAIYVNGVEIGRVNIAANLPLAYNTLTPNLFDPENTGYSPAEGILIPSSVLVAGVNVLAIEVHQNSATSSDVILLVQMTAAVPQVIVEAPVIVQDPVSSTVTVGHRFTLSVLVTGTEPTYAWFKDGTPLGVTTATYSAVADANSGGVYRVDVSNSAGSDTASATVTVRPVIVPYSATWRYNTNSQDGVEWYAVAFDDSTWDQGAGPFGLENAAGQASFPTPIATAFAGTTPTAYFRTTVTVPAVPVGQTLVLCHLVDDGAAIYVDGTLAFRYNMTNNPPILYTNLASAQPAGGDAVTVCVPVTLTPGTHTIAVEVHQSSATSSDVVFGAELRTVTKPGPLTITQPTPTSINLSWTPDPLWTLVQSPVVTGPYTPVAGNPAGTYNTAVAATETNVFYTLRFNGN